MPYKKKINKKIKHAAEQPIKMWEHGKPNFASSLSLHPYTPSFFRACVSLSLPFRHPSALWCQLSVLAFTRQMLVCHTLSLIRRTRARRARTRLNARVSAGLSNRVSASRDLPTWQDTHTHIHTRAHTNLDANQVETRRERWGCGN